MNGDFIYLFNIIGMKAFGHNKLIKLINSLIGHHELIELNCLVGLNKLIKLITSGHNELVVIGHIKLTITSLVGNNGLVGRIKLFKLSKLIVKYLILNVRINGLDRHTSPNGLIGLVSFCIIGLINLLALSKHWLIGLVDFLGCIGLVSFIGLGLVGVIGLSLVSLVRLINRISLVGPIGFSGISGLVGQISLVSLSGISGISSRIDHNGLIGLIGLSLVSLVGLVGHIGFGFVSLIGLGNLSITSLINIISQTGLIGPSALLACQLVSLIGSMAYNCFHICLVVVGAIITTSTTPRRLKQSATHKVAAARLSATEISKANTFYSPFVREMLCWWLAPTRKKMWWWIASFGYSDHNDVVSPQPY
jgi:hypothetical protein